MQLLWGSSDWSPSLARINRCPSSDHPFPGAKGSPHPQKIFSYARDGHSDYARRPESRPSLSLAAFSRPPNRAVRYRQSCMESALQHRWPPTASFRVPVICPPLDRLCLVAPSSLPDDSHNPRLGFWGAGQHEESGTTPGPARVRTSSETSRCRRIRQPRIQSGSSGGVRGPAVYCDDIQTLI